MRHENEGEGRVRERLGRMRRVLMAAALSGLAGTTVARDVSAQTPRPLVKFPAYRADIAMDTMVFSRTVLEAPMGEVFAAVRAVYTQLKIPREIADSTNGLLGTLRLRSTYTVAGERLSVYFNCGMGMTGANADSWRLSIALVTFLQPAGEGKTRLGTGAAAQAQDMGGASKDPLPCGSTGLLETRVLELVKMRLTAR